MSLFLLASFLTVPQGQVHVVDAAQGPGWEFATVAAALQAAAPEDVVLVRSGNYPFEDAVVRESITLVADLGASVVLRGTLWVVDLPADESCLVQGLSVDFQGETSILRDNLGPVWLERCTFHSPFFVNNFGGPRAENCASISIVRSTLDTVELAKGYASFRTRTRLYESFVRGGTAVELDDSSLSLSGCEVAGLDGRDGSLFFPNGGEGGDGALLRNGSRLSLLDSVLRGGEGGTPIPPGQPGLDGEALVLQSGSRARDVGGLHRSLEFSSPVREGSSFTLTLRGQPGDLAWVVIGPEPREPMEWFPPPGPRAWLTLPPSGELVLTLPAPSLPAGVEGQAFFAQGVVRDATSGRLVFSSPSALVVLDETL